MENYDLLSLQTAVKVIIILHSQLSNFNKKTKTPAASVLEGAAPEELAQQRRWRQLAVGYGRDVLQELQQAVRLGVLLGVLGHEFEQRLGLAFYYRKLEEQGGVEHNVGVLLVREYPLVLAGAHAGPAVYSLLRAHSAVLVVADDAAQQTVVRRRYVVMCIKQYGGKRRRIDAELLMLGYLGGKLGVECVYSLDYKHLVVGQAQPPAAAFAAPRLEPPLRRRTGR